MKDEYKTISSPSIGEFKDRGSKFIAYAYHCTTTDQIDEALSKIKKEHPKSRHYCYAYRLGTDKNNFRANDDGEPSGTAGRPILGQIDSYELTNVFCVVVRYFGGTLLGTSGLINAYRTSSQIALQNANIITKIIEQHFKLAFDYGLMSDLMNAVKKLDLNIIEQSFEESAYLIISIKKSEVGQQFIKLKALLLKVSVEQVNNDTKIGGLKINPIHI